MSRRNTFCISILCAAVAAAITAAAFLALDEGPPAGPTHSAAEIRSEPALNVGELRSPQAPVFPPTFAEPTTTTVDWSAIYARAVPSLVSVTTEVGTGSGFFVSENGHVITNLHVVADGDSIRIRTQEGRVLEAELVARDVGNDLALLKVDPAGLAITVPLFANINEVRVGDPVGALGAPFALPNTLTVGIVSALDRDRGNRPQAWEPLRAMIQTDAALNPGNSGGMLVDGRGRVVGIPTQIESSVRSSSGIGFAVSVETLLRSLPTMLEGRDVERTFLGISIDQSSGRIRIDDVYCDSAADQADVRTGDQLIAINDQSADTADELVDVLASITPGEEITITVQRSWRRLELEATAKAWPTSPLSAGCG
ncbi:MAG: trypsin-like peptidase domain-containing protein [Chloroflexi bacterium]|nr:trypsin-like peptidase domain-containing protein [Chloroflexota bacterium]